MATKVVLLSTSDIGHGAGVAAFRLHKSLRDAGTESNMLVCEKLSADPYVFKIKEDPHTRVERFIRGFLHKLENGLNLLGPQNVFSVMASGIQRHPLIRNADVVHLHNIHWSNRNLSLLLLYLKKPVIWTFHDMWPITGHCFYAYSCGRWQTGCGKCPDLDIFPKILYDSTALQWKLKKHIYEKTRPTIVAPSAWLENTAKISPLFSNCRVTRIPYGIDQTEFKFVDKLTARNDLHLDATRKYLAWVASDIKDTRKGFSYFERTMMNLKKLNKIKNIGILLVGKGESNYRLLKSHFQVNIFGHISRSEYLSLVLCASDMLVSTAIQDNLPNIILESFACGTPVAGFNVGGIPDIVKHNVNGYLASVGDCEGLAKGIDSLLSNPMKLQDMGNCAVKTVSEEFTYKLQADRHMNLYRQAVEQAVNK